MSHSLGRYVYGIAAIGFGICTLVWHDFSGWERVQVFGGGPYREIVTGVVAFVEMLGGAAVLWPRAARAGALVLGAMAFVLALLAVPSILEHPLVYNGYGNFFEQFSFVSGAMILYARSVKDPLAQIGYYAFGVCVISFGLEQLFYLAATAGLVPTWIPPGQMFWAVATTAAFILAGMALLTGFTARLASKLNAAMLAGFGLLVWVPALFADVHSFTNWSEGLETLGIAASAWIVAEFLVASRNSSTL